MIDETESLRRQMIAEQQAQGTMERAALEAQYGEVYDTPELTEKFEVLGFSAPFCVVRRRSDGQKGTLDFRHSPRFYYNFQPTVKV